LKGALVARLEGVQALNHLEQRILHEVVRVERAANSSGKPAMRPSLQARQVEGAQIVQRGLVAGLRANEQIERRLAVGATVFVATGRRLAVRRGFVHGGKGPNVTSRVSSYAIQLLRLRQQGLEALNRSQMDGAMPG